MTVNVITAQRPKAVLERAIMRSLAQMQAHSRKTAAAHLSGRMKWNQINR
jgi:translation initiation factor IF-1